MLGPLTYLDIGVLAVCGLSGLLAMYRGLTREALSIVSWALAALAALYFTFYHADIAQKIADDYSQNYTLVRIGLGAIIFIVVLVVVHFITIRFSDSVLDSRVGMIDRILGFGFGVVRGFLLFAIAFLFARYALDEKGLPPWMSEAQSYPYIKDTGETLQAALTSVLPEGFVLSLPEGTGGESQGGEAAAPEGGTTEEPAAPAEGTTTDSGQSG